MSSFKDNGPTNIKLNGQKIEKVYRFKYLESIICDDGRSSIEIKTILQKASTALTRLNPTWKRNYCPVKNETIQDT